MAIGRGIIAAGLLLSLAGILAGGCHQRDATPAQPLTLVVSCDTDGWITPCGCTSNQSGGMLRRGSYLDSLATDRQVVYLDAGGAAAGTSVYQKLKFEAILRGERLMKVAAHNIGQSEAALGAAYLRDISRQLSVPLISTNLRDSSGAPIGETLRIVPAGERRVAIAGVLASDLAASNLTVIDARQAVLQAIADAKGKYDALIVLAYMRQGQIEELASALPEADIIVGGPTGQPISPHRIGPVLVTSSTSKGKFVARIDLDSRPQSPSWTGQIVELDGRFPDDPRQRSVLDAYLAELRKLDLSASESGLIDLLPAGAPASYRVSGNAACVSCHQNDSDLWVHTGHSHAWETLTKKGFDPDPSCRKCHTTGYGLPGGFNSWGNTPSLVGVGCESCHGPSAAHAGDPKIHTTYVAAEQCLRCHDHENSPRFEFAMYWEKIRHGKRETHVAGGGR